MAYEVYIKNTHSGNSRSRFIHCSQRFCEPICSCLKESDGNSYCILGDKRMLLSNGRGKFTRTEFCKHFVGEL